MVEIEMGSMETGAEKSSFSTHSQKNRWPVPVRLPLAKLIPQLVPYLRLATRLFVGCIGYNGLLHDSVKHLDEYSFLDMVQLLANVSVVVALPSNLRWLLHGPRSSRYSMTPLYH
jgi:hypothetical protein